MKNAPHCILHRIRTTNGSLGMLVVGLLLLPFALLGHANCPGNEGRFFRVIASDQAAIIALGADQTVTWTNNALGGTGRIQVATTLLNGGNWTDYTAVPINAWVMTQQVSLALICGGTNSGIDPDFGAYELQESAFFMDPHTVTKTQWDTVRDWAVDNGYTDLPVGGGKGPDHPVHSVHWYDAIKWLNARSEMAGLTPAYYQSTSHTLTNAYRTGNLDLEGSWVRWDAGYRLASSSEWEYAARGGLSGKRFPWGDTINHDHANYVANSTAFVYDTSPYATDTDHPAYNDDITPQTSPADAFAPNGYGLYGMAGNSWEWVFDWHPMHEGSRRTLRGGSWSERADRCRIGFKSNTPPNHTFSGISFRAVLAPAPPPLGESLGIPEPDHADIMTGESTDSAISESGPTGSEEMQEPGTSHATSQSASLSLPLEADQGGSVTAGGAGVLLFAEFGPARHLTCVYCELAEDECTCDELHIVTPLEEDGSTDGTPEAEASPAGW